MVLAGLRRVVRCSTPAPFLSHCFSDERAAAGGRGTLVQPLPRHQRVARGGRPRRRARRRARVAHRGARTRAGGRAAAGGRAQVGASVVGPGWRGARRTATGGTESKRRGEMARDKACCLALALPSRCSSLNISGASRPWSPAVPRGSALTPLGLLTATPPPPTHPLQVPRPQGRELVAGGGRPRRQHAAGHQARHAAGGGRGLQVVGQQSWGASVAGLVRQPWGGGCGRRHKGGCGAASLETCGPRCATGKQKGKK